MCASRREEVGVTYQWSRLGLYADGMGGTEALPESDGRYVLAEDAIAREAELLARIQELEERAVKAASLVSAAIDLASPSNPGGNADAGLL
jgi:hypothetical protein